MKVLLTLLLDLLEDFVLVRAALFTLRPTASGSTPALTSSSGWNSRSPEMIKCVHNVMNDKSEKEMDVALEQCISAPIHC